MYAGRKHFEQLKSWSLTVFNIQMLSQRHEIHIPFTLIFQIINEICSAFDKDKSDFITTNAASRE